MYPSHVDFFFPLRSMSFLHELFTDFRVKLILIISLVYDSREKPNLYYYFKIEIDKKRNYPMHKKTKKETRTHKSTNVSFNL